MYDLTDEMFEDDETIATSTTGMMTPTSTITRCPTDREVQEPTITILVKVLDTNGYCRKNAQIKLHHTMLFGEIVKLLKTKFEKTEKFCLRMKLGTPKFKDGTLQQQEYRIIFDSDTPASLDLKDRAELEFAYQDIESIDVSHL